MIKVAAYIIRDDHNMVSKIFTIQYPTYLH